MDIIPIVKLGEVCRAAYVRPCPPFRPFLSKTMDFRGCFFLVEINPRLRNASSPPPHRYTHTPAAVHVFLPASTQDVSFTRRSPAPPPFPRVTALSAASRPRVRLLCALPSWLGPSRPSSLPRYLAAHDEDCWRRVGRLLWGELLHSPPERFESFRQMCIQRPRLMCHGVYISA